jgi:hypothetical protein
LICNIYLISTRCFNIGGDIGIHEEIHLRHTHGYFVLQIPFMFKNKTSFVNINLKCIQQHWWCNDSTARFVCGRKWVRASVGYDKRL